MATKAPAQLVYLANAWEKLYGSAVISGIVGDLAHKLRGGFHISIEDQPSTNYSVTRKDDKAPPGNWPRDMASAIDMTLSTADIKKCHIRLRDAWKNRAADPRMKYINAWNGWDGQGDAGRYDVVTGSVGTATSDHKWHIHLEIRRKYVNSRAAMDAILSILRGETVEQYLGEDDMTKDELVAFLKTTEARNLIASAVWNTDNVVAAPGSPKAGKNADGTDVNTHWAATSYLQSIYGVANNTQTAVKNTASEILTTVKANASVDIDEVALGAAIASNPVFVESLAASVAAKVGGGSDVKSAVREVLGQTRLTVQ